MKRTPQLFLLLLLLVRSIIIISSVVLSAGVPLRRLWLQKVREVCTKRLLF